MAGYKNLKRARRDEDEDLSSEEVAKSTKKTNKKTKTAAGAGEAGKDDDGNPFWSLSANRRVNMSEFKGKMLINIREYWTDPAGDLKPGKKGISLSLEQYQSLLKAIPAINSQLRDQGHDVPDVGAAPAAAVAEESESEAAPKEKKSSKPKPKKANIEATSDEEEDSE